MKSPYTLAIAFAGLSLLIGNRCVGPDSTTAVFLHSNGQMRRLTRSAGDSVLALLEVGLRSATQLRLLVTEMMVEEVRDEGAIEVLLPTEARFRGGARTFGARRLLVPISGRLTAGPNNAKRLVAFWGGDTYVSGPFAIADAGELLGRLVELSSHLEDPSPRP